MFGDFNRSIDYIRNIFFKCYFLGKTEIIAFYFVLECNNICSCSMLRDTVIASIGNDITNEITSSRKFVIDYVEAFSAVVFG